jgi:inner membrane protein
MASIGHVAIGLAAGRFYTAPPDLQRRLIPAMAVFSALSLLPDADVIGFAMGIPYAHPFGHRGASHALSVALLFGLFAWLLTRLAGLPPARSALITALVVASHGLADALTNGGLGIGLLWPFSNERFFAPWRPIPVAPIGMRFFSPRGLRVAAVEVVYFLPLFLYALWPRRRGSVLSEP